MHQQYITNVAHPGDVFISVFPRHRDEIEVHDYPGKVETLLTPSSSPKGCALAVQSSQHNCTASSWASTCECPPSPPSLSLAATKSRSLCSTLCDYRSNFSTFLIRPVIDLEVQSVRQMYTNGGRRDFVHARLSQLYDDFESHAKHVLFDVIGEPRRESSTPERAGRDTFKLYSTRNEKGPSIGTAMTRVVVLVPKVGEQPETKGRASNQVTESKDVIALKGNMHSGANPTALQPPAIAFVTPKASAPETMGLKAFRESQKPVAEALIALRPRHIRPRTDMGTLHATLDTKKKYAAKTTVTPPVASITAVTYDNAREKTLDSDTKACCYRA